MMDAAGAADFITEAVGSRAREDVLLTRFIFT